MASGKLLLNPSEEGALVRLISTIERKTTGEVRIHLAKRSSKNGPIKDAQKVFLKLGMNKTDNHNGVLVFVSVEDRQIACIGDYKVHQVVGDIFWNEVVELLRSTFQKGDYFIGLYKALEKIGDVLVENFPFMGDPDTNRNELPDDISKE